MRNNGQTCTNATRVLAPARSATRTVVEALREQIGAFAVGDPADPGVDVGPLVSDVQRERVEGYIATGRDEGARLVLGGGRRGRDRGYFVEPTIFADVDNAMTIAQEEIFGPVVVRDPLRRRGRRGGASPTTPLRALGQRLGPGRRARQGRRAADPQRQRRGQPAHARPGGPFGGFKQSGIGRENGLEGIEAYIEVQTHPLPCR